VHAAEDRGSRQDESDGGRIGEDRRGEAHACLACEIEMAAPCGLVDDTGVDSVAWLVLGRSGWETARQHAAEWNALARTRAPPRAI